MAFDDRVAGSNPVGTWMQDSSRMMFDYRISPCNRTDASKILLKGLKSFFTFVFLFLIDNTIIVLLQFCIMITHPFILHPIHPTFIL